MTDLATLGIKIDSSQVKTGVADLDKLTAAGARAEAATLGVGRGSKSAAAEAAAMAAAAQASARAATGMATGFKASEAAMRVNTVAMRETLVVARELSRGNFTRIPGSLTLLAQGIGSQGGLKAFGAALSQTLGLVKTVQNAELAEQATQAAASAAAIESAAARAAAAVTAADTELALAEAQARVTAGTSAEGAASVRLAEAHQAVAAAAGEAAIAENALASAYARADEAAAASAAESTTVVTGLGLALGAAAIAGGLAAVALASVKDAAEEADPSAQHFISTLGLTSKEVEKLKDTTVTWGDVAHGTFDAVAQAAGVSSSQFASFWREAFLETAQVGVSAAQVIAGAFAAVASVAKNLQNVGLAAINPSLSGILANGVPSPQKVGQDALNAFEKQFSATGKFFHQTLPNAVNQARDNRLQNQANKLIADRTPHKGREGRSANDNSDENEKRYQDEVARLNDQILTARRQLAGSAQEQADLEIQQIDVEKNKTITDAKSLQSQGKITAGEEQHLELLANQLADLKKQAVLREEETKLLTQQQAAQDQLFGFQTDALKFADEMATTQADHRKAQLDMLDIAYEQKKYDLQILESKQELAKDFAAAAITQAQIDNLPVQKARDQQRVVNNTLDPLQQWAKGIPKDAKTITEALQGIEAHGLDSLASSITDVITGAKSLKQAFKETAQSIIADIVQMIVKMLIFRALSSIFGGAFGGGIPSASPPFGSANGNIFLGGNVIPFANGGIVSGPTLFPMNGGRTGMMGEAGPEAIMPLTRDSSGRLGIKANDNTRGPIELVVSFGDAPDFAPYVESVSQRHAQEAVIVSVRHTNDTVRKINRPKLQGGR